jgi:hypothetical protein
VRSGGIKNKLFLLETERKKRTERRPRRKQQVWRNFIQNGERTWKNVDKDLWAEKEVLLLNTSQNFDTSEGEFGTSDQ